MRGKTAFDVEGTVVEKLPPGLLRIELANGFARIAAWDWEGEGTQLAVRGQVRLADRQAARANKDFAAADALRAELQADGWTVETSKSGTSLRR